MLFLVLFRKQKYVAKIRRIAKKRKRNVVIAMIHQLNQKMKSVILVNDKVFSFTTNIIEICIKTNLMKIKYEKRNQQKYRIWFYFCVIKAHPLYYVIKSVLAFLFCFFSHQKENFEK